MLAVLLCFITLAAISDDADPSLSNTFELPSESSGITSDGGLVLSSLQPGINWRNQIRTSHG